MVTRQRRHHTISWSGLLATLGYVVGGCAASNLEESNTRARLESQSQIAALVRERETEVKMLRDEMAATRIAAAKKEAEVIELRDLVAQLRQENAESHQGLRTLQKAEANKQTEIASLLQQQAPGNQSTTEAQTVKALSDSLQALTKELAVVKHMVVQTSASGPMRTNGSPSLPEVKEVLGESAQATASPSPLSSQRPTIEPALHVMTAPSDAVPSAVPLTVQAGDTLWDIARDHGVTVEAIRRVNKLTKKPLLVGQRLLIPKPRSVR